MAPRRPAKVKNATNLKNGDEIAVIIDAPLQLNGSANLETDILEVESRVDLKSKTMKKQKLPLEVEEVKSTKNGAKQQGRKPIAQKVDTVSVRSESPVYEDMVDEFNHQDKKLTVTKKSSSAVKSSKNNEKLHTKQDKKPIATKGRPRKALPKTDESNDNKIDAHGDILDNQEIEQTNSTTKSRKGATNKIGKNLKKNNSDEQVKSLKKNTKNKNRAVQEENTTPMMTKIIETTESDIDSEKSEKVKSKEKVKNNRNLKQEEEPVEVVTSKDKIAKEPKGKGKKKINIDKQSKQDEEPVQQGKSENTKERKPKGKKKDMESTDSQSGVEPALKKRKVNKKDEKGQGDMATVDSKSVIGNKPKGKRGAKRLEISKDAEEVVEEPVTKRRRKPTDENVVHEDKKKKAPLKNKSATNYDDLHFENSSKNDIGKEWNFKISSWNVDGLRAWITKGGLDYLKYEKPNILCLQETKCSQDKLPEEINVPGYHTYWLGSDKDGYAGVGIFTTKMAINVQYGLQNEELDNEGRIITAEYEQFYLISTYVPNAGRKLVTLPKRLQWNDEFRKFVKELDKKKPVIVCGDMNVAHQEIDLANPKTNKRNAGFTEEERAGMSELLGDGFVDTFRHFYPDRAGAYTFWTYMMNSRAKNVGWRLDYFIVSERLLPMICDNVIRSEVYGSDHCPISLFMHLTSAEKPKEP